MSGLVRATPAGIALGANLGEPLRQLEGALVRLRADPDVLVEAVSPWYRTRPVGGPPGQPDFVNGVVLARTRLAPEGLLRRLLAIERAFGRRRRRGEHDAPRILDLDLLFHGEARVDSPRLSLPHPRLEQRAFVLVPLADLDPERRLASGLRVRERLERVGRAGVEPLVPCAAELVPARAQPWPAVPEHGPTAAPPSRAPTHPGETDGGRNGCGLLSARRPSVPEAPR